MTINNSKHNPKALNLTGLETINKKVTVGFKCHAKIKLHLASEAKKAGLTLSEYTETLLQEFDAAVQLEKNEVEKLQQQLAFYENDILIDLFNNYDKQEISYTNTKGENIKILIKDPKDVYTILINSFKPKK